MLRVVLLFGSVAVALALILAPVLDNGVNGFLARNDDRQGVDMMRTGTIGTRAHLHDPQERPAVSPNSVCIMRSNGTSSGDC